LKSVKPYDGRNSFAFNTIDQLPEYAQSELPIGSVVLVTFTISHYAWNPSDREKPSPSANISKSPSRMVQSGYKKMASFNLQEIVILYGTNTDSDELTSSAGSPGEIF
jgi:hypothetical protein